MDYANTLYFIEDEDISSHFKCKMHGETGRNPCE